MKTINNWLPILSFLISVGTLVFVICRIRLLYKQIRDEHDWRRCEKAVEFSQIYKPELRQIKQKLRESFKTLHERKDPLSTEEIRNADPALREDINYLLAYLENIGICCKHNIASFVVVYDLMANTYLNHHYLFQPWIKNGQSRNPRLWQNIEWMVERINNEKRNRDDPEIELPITGDV